jgi:hypothetical protein
MRDRKELFLHEDFIEFGNEPFGFIDKDNNHFLVTLSKGFRRVFRIEAYFSSFEEIYNFVNSHRFIKEKHCINCGQEKLSVKNILCHTCWLQESNMNICEICNSSYFYDSNTGIETKCKCNENKGE